MNSRSVRCLRGPNTWAACPVLEVALDLSEGRWSSEEVRQTLSALESATLLDTRREAELSELLLAQAFSQLARKLQELAGTPVSFTAVRETSQPGLFLTAIAYVEEVVGQAAVESALRFLQAARQGQPLPLQEDLRRLRELEYRRRLPASTAVIYHAARARGIPVCRLNPEYGRYLRLGQGSKQHRCLASEPDTVSAVARMVSTDKHLAKQLLQAAGVPVPQGQLVSTPEEAWSAACALGLPVAIKPVDSDLATGVSLDLRTREQVEAGFRDAQPHGSEVLVERFAPGLEHRVLVVGDRVVAVSRIDPPHVVGDGVATMAELVDRVNQDPRRGDEGSRSPLYKIRIDDVAHEVLAGQGCTVASIPKRGERVLLRRNPPYIKNGGCLSDLTDHIHPSTAAHAVAAAQTVQLPVAGLDVVALDISKPLEEQGGVIVEINTSPGLWLHLAPWADSPRPVGQDIVDSLYPPGYEGRIPVAALVGDVTGGATRHLTALLTFAGLRVGSTDEAEIVVASRSWTPQARTPQERAGVLFQDPTVDVALLKTTPRELVEAGFGNDRCDVALVLTGAAQEGGDEPGAFLRVLRHALGSQGVLIAGDRSPIVQGNQIALAQGTEASVVLGDRPDRMSERETSDLLGALAAGLALGLKTDTLKGYLNELA